jgi:hypothetical protein
MILMALSIVGAGLGRTGTLSLKIAIEQLGLGPCFHCMDDPGSLIGRVWSLALAREPVDWDAIFSDYRAAVDVPFSWFHRDIAQKCPSAKFILTVRDPNSWFDSASAIRPHLKAIGLAEDSLERSERELLSAIVPPEVVDLIEFRDRESVLAASERFNAAVQKEIPPDRLLVFNVKQGWQPLCEFLGVSIPDATPFPHVNSAGEFQSLLQRKFARTLEKSAGPA